MNCYAPDYGYMKMNYYAPDYGYMKMKIVGVVKAVLGYECQHVYIYIY